VKPTSDPRQIKLLPPDAAAIVHLVRENLRILTDLATRYEIGLPSPAAKGVPVHNPADIASYFGPELSDLAQEQLRVVLLDVKNQVLATPLVYQGGLNATVIRLSDCFREAVCLGAAAIVFVHNHPSGDPTPSPEDVRLTEEAARVGDLLGIDVLDHIVIARSGHVSLREHGLYAPTRVAPNVAVD
jgi:DNA repair protein RadC